jgi:hypothetical protein
MGPPTRFGGAWSDVLLTLAGAAVTLVLAHTAHKETSMIAATLTLKSFRWLFIGTITALLGGEARRDRERAFARRHTAHPPARVAISLKNIVLYGYSL